MKPIIKVSGISKQYRIGAARLLSAGSLRESLTELAKTPFKRLKQNGNANGEVLWALRDINFEVEQGEIVAIVGGNGAGKSTLLKLLSRIAEPTSGRIELYGRVGSLLEVGTGFHPELTGRENVFLNGAIMGMARAEIERKFAEIVDFSEIEKFIDTPVKRYSSGMYMRLAFSVAAHLEPEILVVDEVLAVGDAQFQKKCLGKIGDVAKAGRTVLFVSHSMEAVRKLCSRGMLLEHGRVTFQGSVEAVINKYMEVGTEVHSSYAIPPPENAEDLMGYAYELIVEDGNSKPATAIPVGQNWQVRVRFKINRRVEHFIIALGLLSNMSTPLRTSWSTPQTIEPGDYEAVFREEVILLASGRYTIVLGLSSYERSFHFVENAGILEIADFSEGIDLVRISGAGQILNPLQTVIQKSA
jgi:lipopolysaccharide transport system ATP-binding protein